MINSRSLDDLDPIPRDVAKAHIAACAAAGIEIIVTSTYRDFESQAQLYSIGRQPNDARKPVTNAQAGHSWHNYRCAYDVVPVVQGKPVWDAADPLWKHVIDIGKQMGAEAGADWKTFPDMPHFQKLPVSTIDFAEARARWDAHGTIFT